MSGEQQPVVDPQGVEVADDAAEGHHSPRKSSRKRKKRKHEEDEDKDSGETEEKVEAVGEVQKMEEVEVRAESKRPKPEQPRLENDFPASVKTIDKKTKKKLPKSQATKAGPSNFRRPYGNEADIDVIDLVDNEEPEMWDTMTVLVYKSLDGKQDMSLTRGDVKGLMKQPHGMITVDSLLFLCKLSLDAHFDSNQAVFVHDIPLLHAYMSGNLRSIEKLERLSPKKHFWERLFKSETILMPLHHNSHFSLAVIRGISAAFNCFSSGICTCPQRDKVISIMHYDSWGLPSLHTADTVFRCVTGWLHNGGFDKMGFKMTSDQFSQHFRVKRIESCIGDQRENEMTCGVFTAMYAQSAITMKESTSSKQSSAAAGRPNPAVDSFIVFMKDKLKDLMAAHGGKEVVVKETNLRDFYRLPIAEIPHDPSVADIMQFANWKIDVCVANLAEFRSLDSPRPDRKKSVVKADFKKRFATDVRKGAKLAKTTSEGPRDRVNIAMGSILNAVDICYHMPGEDIAEGVFIAMRSYSDSYVTSRGQNYLFSSFFCKKIDFDMSKRAKKTKSLPTLHTDLRNLLATFTVHIKSPYHLTSLYALDARIRMQEISVHVVAACEYVLQCLDSVAPRDAHPGEGVESEFTSRLKDVQLQEQSPVPHKVAAKQLLTGIDSGTFEEGPHRYASMEEALNIAQEAMKTGGKNFSDSHKSLQKAQRKKKNERGPVQASDLESIPKEIIAEAGRSLLGTISSRIKKDAGEDVKKYCMQIFTASNAIYQAIHPPAPTAPTAPAPTASTAPASVTTAAPGCSGTAPINSVNITVSPPYGVEILDDDRRRRIKLGRPKLRSVPVPSQPQPRAASSSTANVALTLPINITEPSSWLHSFSADREGLEVVFVSCIFRALSHVLKHRHFSSRVCQQTCPSKLKKSFDKSVGLIMREPAPSWIAGIAPRSVKYSSTRMREPVVRACMEFASHGDLSCFLPFDPNGECIGPNEIRYDGQLVQWFGCTGLVDYIGHVNARMWQAGNATVGIGPVSFPSSWYGEGDVFSDGTSLESLKINYTLQYSPNDRVDMRTESRPINFDFMDMLWLKFLDKNEVCVGVKYAIVVDKPSRMASGTNSSRHGYTMNLLVLEDASSSPSFPKSVRDLVTVSGGKGRRKRSGSQVHLYKITREGASRYYSVFAALNKDLPAISPTIKLGFSDIAGLIQSQLQNFALLVFALSQFHVETMVQQTSSVHPVVPKETASSLMHRARNKVSAFAAEVTMPLNPSQLDLLSSWAAMAEAYYSLPPSWIHAMSSRRDQHGQANVNHFGSRVLFCQGPPGTGKSYVASLLLRAVTRRLLAEGRQDWDRGGGVMDLMPSFTGRALVLSVTNAAVDDLFTTYLAGIGGRTGADTSLPVRIGVHSTRREVKEREVNVIAKRLTDDARKSGQTAVVTGKDVLNKYPVVFSTLGSALRHSWDDVTSFDLVVVDEAAYVDETEVLACLSRILHAVGEPPHGTTVTFFGDPRQLQPFDSKDFKSWTAAKQAETHFFQGAINTLSREPQFHRGSEQRQKELWESFPATVFQLNEQMRSADAIGSLVSNLFYDGKITNGRRSARREWVVKKNMERIVSKRLPLKIVNLVDTMVCEGRSAETPGQNGGYKNVYEAELIREMVKTWLPRHSAVNLSVGVLTPYNAQKSLIERKLSEIGRSRVADVLTFDSSQGKEYDVVLISLVRTKVTEELCGNAALQFLDNRHAACVALSRPREVLIVVGQVSTISKGSTVWMKCFHDIFAGSRRSGNEDYAYLEPVPKATSVQLVPKDAL